MVSEIEAVEHDLIVHRLLDHVHKVSFISVVHANCAIVLSQVVLRMQYVPLDVHFEFCFLQSSSVLYK